ncbi:MAG: TIGR02452 family protein [Saprospiraceae bacterium]|nr:TIGR02452 family protein [Saprospiraceae bacterium]
MNRKGRAAISAQTVNILEQAYYHSQNGKQVVLTISMKEALQAAKHYTPEALDQLLKNPAPNPRQEPTIFEVRNETTLHAAHRLQSKENIKEVFCQNFASAKNPGGGYMGGSTGQEESLARSTGLVPTLEKHMGIYHIGRSCGTALYTDNMIYSPHVPVFRNDNNELLDEPYQITIITSAAVNAGALNKNERKKMDMIYEVMEQRIAKLLSIAHKNQHDTLVLGAWGCGVFRNDPKLIVRAFQSNLLDGGRFKDVFKRIVFAVLDNTKKEEIIRPFREGFPSI